MLVLATLLCLLLSPLYRCDGFVGGAAGVGGLDFDGVYGVLAELDKLAGQETAGGGGAARGGGGKKSKKATEKKTGFSYTGLPFSAGPLSATDRGSPTAAAPLAAARKDEEQQPPHAAEARRVAGMADISTELQPASKLFLRAAISAIEADVGKGQLQQRHDEEGSGVEGLERKAAGLLEHDREEEEAKVEVAAKYVFVHNWLLRLLQAAEHVTAQHSNTVQLSASHVMCSLDCPSSSTVSACPLFSA